MDFILGGLIGADGETHLSEGRLALTVVCAVNECGSSGDPRLEGESSGSPLLVGPPAPESLMAVSSWGSVVHWLPDAPLASSFLPSLTHICRCRHLSVAAVDLTPSAIPQVPKRKSSDVEFLVCSSWPCSAHRTSSSVVWALCPLLVLSMVSCPSAWNGLSLGPASFSTKSVLAGKYFESLCFLHCPTVSGLLHNNTCHFVRSVICLSFSCALQPLRILWMRMVSYMSLPKRGARPILP